MASIGQCSRRCSDAGSRSSTSRILVTAALAIVLAIGFDLTSIASIGSAVALVVFTLVTAGHLRVRTETGAHAWLWCLLS